MPYGRDATKFENHWTMYQPDATRRVQGNPSGIIFHEASGVSLNLVYLGRWPQDHPTQALWNEGELSFLGMRRTRTTCDFFHCSGIYGSADPSLQTVQWRLCRPTRCNLHCHRSTKGVFTAIWLQLLFHTVHLLRVKWVSIWFRMVHQNPTVCISRHRVSSI